MKDLETERDVTVEGAACGLSAEPFQPGTNLKFLWLGEAQRKALGSLKSGILNNAGVLVLTGDVGTGKTMLVHALLEDLGDRVVAASVSCGGLDASDFFAAVAEAYGLEAPAGNRDLFRHRFERFLGDASSRGQPVLLILDEAQTLNRELVSEIAGLTAAESAAPRLSILLVGQNELDGILSEPDSAALSARVKVRGATRPLTPAEVKQYVEHRLKMAGAIRPVFTAGALREIAAFSQGIPRLVNVIGDLALTSRFRRSASTINAEIVRACEGRLGRSRRKARAARRRREAAAALSVEAKEPVGIPQQSPTDAPQNGAGRVSTSEVWSTEDLDTGKSGQDLTAAPAVEPEGRAAPPPVDAEPDGKRAALGPAAQEPEDRERRGAEPEIRLVPSADGGGRAALARRIAPYAAAGVLLLAMAGVLYYSFDSAVPRPVATPEESRETPVASGRSDAFSEAVVDRAAASVPDAEAPKPAPFDVLPASTAITPLDAPPKAVAGGEHREVTGGATGPAAAGRVILGQTPEAAGRRPGEAGQGEIPKSPRRPAGAAAPLGGGPESTDPGAIIDWLLSEYPARRQ